MKARYLLIFALALITLVGIIPAGCTSTPDMGGLTVRGMSGISFRTAPPR